MRGRWASWVVLVGIGFGCGCSRKKAESAPNPVVATVADVHDKPGKVDAGPIDAGPTEAVPEPGPTAPLTVPPGERVPIESLFEVMYTPDEALPDKLRRRIRFRLKDRSRAPIALHHIIDIPKPDGSREVFALYESSVYEDCVQGYTNRKEGRDHCLGKLEKGPYEGAPPLNRACVALGAVRAVFGPPGPGETADTGGSLTITSIAFTDALCEVRSYNRLLVADVDGDEQLEMYVDITTSKEVVREVRYGEGKSAPRKLSDSQRQLYVLSSDNVAELSLYLVDRESLRFVDSFLPEDPVEFRDIDGDGHLDVIQTLPCIVPDFMFAPTPCDSTTPRERIAYLYDVAKDSYKAGVAVKAPAEEAAPSPTPEEAPPTPEEAEHAAQMRSDAEHPPHVEAPATPEEAEVTAPVPAPAPSDASMTAPKEAPVKAPSGSASAQTPSGSAPAQAPSGGAPTQAPSGKAPVQAPAGGTPARP